MKKSHGVVVRVVSATMVLLGLVSGCGTGPKHSARGSRDREFIAYWPAPEGGGRLRLAVKDLIDVKGSVTTAGSEYFARNRRPAGQDARCLELARERGVHLVGKTNLTEFAATVSGRNDYFGIPRNRVSDKHKIIPGGSSSGSAVAVANDRADVSFGTDTAGSVRVPAACSGVCGLKTTYGLVSLRGVVPLSPRYLDTVGPMAKDIPRLVQGMDLLERGFAGKYERAAAAHPSARAIRIGRLYLDGTDPAVDRAIDEALAAKHFRVVKLDKDFKARWDQAEKDGKTVALADVWRNCGKYLDSPGVSGLTKTVIIRGRLESEQSYAAALKRRAAWQRALRRTFQEVDFIALPTLQKLPPRIPFFGISAVFEAEVFALQNTVAVNYAGNPALAVPVPIESKEVPVTSLQLVGPRFSEAELLNAGRLVLSKP